MAAITEILEMIKNILAYFNEADAASVIEIVKNGLEAIFANIGAVFRLHRFFCVFTLEIIYLFC